MQKSMFTKFQNFLHNAVEVLAPEQNLLESFKFHWKSVTQFFVDSLDERVSVESTSIPTHLERMISILQDEERELGMENAGPCMEFLLQHKVLETMQTLGRADCPPGMKRQVLMFFTNLLGKSKQQLLPHINVHRPVNKLIRCCGEIKAAPTEIEEVQFLVQVSSKLKQDSYLVHFFLESFGNKGSNVFSSRSPGGPDGSKPEYSLVESLLELMKSEDSRVAIKACEGLLLCTSVLEDQAATVIVLYTTFCERIADQMCKLFKCLPAVMDPADIAQLSATWGFHHEDEAPSTFAGRRQLIAFFSWLDYVNQLTIEAHPMIAMALAQAVRERFISAAIEPGLCQASEACAITVTAVLTRCLKNVTSSTLIEQFAESIIGSDSRFEVVGHDSTHKVRRLLIQRIDHLSDQLTIETLRLFQALLHLSHQPIVDTLLVRNLRGRPYFDVSKVSSEEGRERLVSLVRKSERLLASTQSARSEYSNSALPPKVSKPERFEVSSTTALTLSDEFPMQNLDSSEVHKGSSGHDSSGDDVSLAVSALLGNIESNSRRPSQPVAPCARHDATSPGANEGELVAGYGVVLDSSPLRDTAHPVEPRESIGSSRCDEANDGGERCKPISLVSENASDGALPDAVPEDVALVDAFLQSESGEDNANNKKRIFNKKRVEKVVNGFLMLMPDILKTSNAIPDSGYDTYLRDAHRQCQLRASQTATFTWDSESDDVEKREGEFFAGTFLTMIFKRLQRIPDQPLEVNLEITALISLLAQFNERHLHEFLLDTSLSVKDGVLTLHHILQQICQDLNSRASKIPNFQQSLLLVRKKMMSMNDKEVSLPNEQMYEGIICLEEFCKELAAIAFVKATMSDSRQFSF